MTKNDVFQALLRNKEGTTEYTDGSIWGEVYIPNIGSSHEIAGYLSALKKDGVYRPVADCLGEVKIQ